MWFKTEWKRTDGQTDTTEFVTLLTDAVGDLQQGVVTPAHRVVVC